MLGEKVRILLQKAHKRSEFGLNSLKKKWSEKGPILTSQGPISYLGALLINWGHWCPWNVGQGGTLHLQLVVQGGQFKVGAGKA